jgi:NitT/TauT family transport system substrate-binding protein
MLVHPRPRAAALLAAGLVLASATAGSAQQPAPLFPLVVNTTTPTDVLPFFYARAHGMFKAAGLNVQVQLAPSGSVSLLSIVGGASQIGFVNTLTLTNARDKEIKIDMFAPGGEYNTDDPNARLLVLPDSPIQTAADLDGKTIAVTGLHDLLAVSTTAWLDKHGGHPSTVRFVELAGSSMYPALVQKRVDAIAIYDPYASAAVENGARTIGKPFDGVATHFLTAGFCAQAAWLKAHQSVADRFAQVIHDAAEYTNAHYSELIPFIAQYSKLPEATLEKVAHQQVPPAVRTEDVQPVIDAAAQYEHLKYFAAADEIFKVRLRTASNP